MPPKKGQARHDYSKLYELTPAEKEVDTLVSEGLTKPEICLRLNKNYRTVTTLVGYIAEKKRAMWEGKK